MTAFVVALVCAAFGLGVLALTPSAPAGAQPGDDQPFTVTIAARQCAAYSDVMANRARNDIQESLQDLGKDTVYAGGEPIDPTKEDNEANNPGCEPLDGWKFTLGDAYTKPASSDPSVQSFSIVQGNEDTTGTTGTTALLDDQGNDTGKTLAGAVTVTLNEHQVSRALSSNQLWLQGGTPDDPQLDKVFPGKYAFAALRCAIDNLNGDNVEWIGYPNAADGTRSHHVFCWTYYINPRPGFGSVTIRKAVTPGTSAGATFTFGSNLTYESDNTFSLTASGGSPGSQTFDRAASADFGHPYTVNEQVPDGWQLTDRACQSETGDSTTNADVGASGLSIVLAEGDHVTCTFTDHQLARPGLRVSKVTTGGVGGPFDFHLTGPGGFDERASATTTTEGNAVVAFARDSGLDAGTYTIDETLPAPPANEAGHWEFVTASCPQGQRSVTSRSTTGGSISVDLTLTPEASAADCLFQNQFVPNGRITYRLRTLGGTATGRFVTTGTGVGAAPRNPVVSTATTSAAGVPAVAEDNPGGLALQAWSAVTLPPDNPPGGGRWRFVSFVCVPAGAATRIPSAHPVTLTLEEPAATCTATYQLDPGTKVVLVKHAVGPASARHGDAVITLSCSDSDDNSRRLALPADESTATTANDPAVIFDDDVSCRVTETASGAAPGASVDVTATIDPPGSAPITLPHTFTVDRSVDLYTVEVTNTYTAPPTSPTSTPTATAPTTAAPTPPASTSNGPPPPASGTSGTGLAQTGFGTVVGLVAGLVLLAFGALTVVAARRRT